MTPDLEKQIRDWVKSSEGWTTEDRALEMAQLILDNKPDVVVEIGVFGGRSFIPQALALKENGRGHIYGIDPWTVECAIEGENEANVNWWRKNMDINVIHQYCVNAVWKYGVQERAIIIRAASQYCPQLFPKIDTLLIDGCHSEVASTRDAEHYLPRVKKGGFVWADDCDWATTKRMQTMIEEKCDVLKVGDNGHYKLYKKR